MCICWNSIFLSLLDYGWYYSCPAPSTSHQGCLKQKKPTEEFCHSLFFFPSLMVPHLFFKISFFCLWFQGFFKHCGRKRGPCVYSSFPFSHQTQDRRAETVVRGESHFCGFHAPGKANFVLFLSVILALSQHSLRLFLPSQVLPQLQSVPCVTSHQGWSWNSEFQPALPKENTGRQCHSPWEGSDFWQLHFLPPCLFTLCKY